MKSVWNCVPIYLQYCTMTWSLSLSVCLDISLCLSWSLSISRSLSVFLCLFACVVYDFNNSIWNECEFYPTGNRKTIPDKKKYENMCHKRCKQVGTRYFEGDKIFFPMNTWWSKVQATPFDFTQDDTKSIRACSISYFFTINVCIISVFGFMSSKIVIRGRYLSLSE